MRPPKRTMENTFGPILKVFENLEKEEMQNFYDDFENYNSELAHELMSELEGKVIERVNDLLDYWVQNGICFFEENEIKIKDTIKTSIWRVIVNELIDNELGEEFKRIK